MFTKLKNRQEGFTIIEVMIVLVIAAVILLIVFLAVPALQRNSRNTQRKNVNSDLLTAAGEYAGNNNGNIPNASVSNVTPPNDASKILALVNTNNLLTVFAVQNVPTTAAQGSPVTLTTAPSLTTSVLVTNATCNGNAVQASNTPRQIVLVYQAEINGGAGQNVCTGSGL